MPNWCFHIFGTASRNEKHTYIRKSAHSWKMCSVLLLVLFWDHVVIMFLRDTREIGQEYLCTQGVNHEILISLSVCWELDCWGWWFRTPVGPDNSQGPGQSHLTQSACPGQRTDDKKSTLLIKLCLGQRLSQRSPFSPPDTPSFLPLLYLKPPP